MPIAPIFLHGRRVIGAGAYGLHTGSAYRLMHPGASGIRPPTRSHQGAGQLGSSAGAARWQRVLSRRDATETLSLQILSHGCRDNVQSRGVRRYSNASTRDYSEPEMGFEPMTCALRVRCSTTELPGRVVSMAWHRGRPVPHRPWPGHRRRQVARLDTALSARARRPVRVVRGLGAGTGGPRPVPARRGCPATTRPPRRPWSSCGRC